MCIALRRLSAQALAGTLFVARAHAGPGGQVFVEIGKRVISIPISPGFLQQWWLAAR